MGRAYTYKIRDIERGRTYFKYWSAVQDLSMQLYFPDRMKKLRELMQYFGGNKFFNITYIKCYFQNSL